MNRLAQENQTFWALYFSSQSEDDRTSPGYSYGLERTSDRYKSYEEELEVLSQKVLEGLRHSD